MCLSVSAYVGGVRVYSCVGVLSLVGCVWLGDAVMLGKLKSKEGVWARPGSPLHHDAQ